MKNKLIIICLLLFTHSIAQKETPLNNPIYDNQSYHFGFTIGLSQNKFQIEYSDFFLHQESFEQVLSKYTSGFNVGIIMDFRISNRANIRLTPSFNFTDQKIYYLNNNIESLQPNGNTGVSNFEIPIYLKYRSDRINNGRSYLLLGSSFIIDMSSIEKLSQTTNIKFSKFNYSIDIGFGVDIYFAYFKFSPEIKYCYGLKNILINQDNIYSEALQRLSTRAILISLTFE